MTMRILSISAIVLGLATPAGAGFDTATFSDTGLPLTGPGAGMPAGSGPYNNNSGGFDSGGQYFSNVYNSTYGSWSGFSVSAATNTTSPGFTNQYAAITGSGNGTPDYGMVYASAYVNLTGNVQSIDLTNSTYAYLSMLNGDQFAKKFAAGDFFDVVITGYTGQDATGNSTGAVTYYLANFTGGLSMLASTWTTVSLTSLGSAESIGFSFQSSDFGQFGINTPEYVAVDNLVVAPAFVPEPSSALLCATGLIIGLAAAARRRRLARFTHV